MKLRRLFAVGAGLLGVQIPFILTGHIQEDAYITFRCAVNLAATGVYGYNPGERVSASTSHLSVFILALLRLAAGEQFIVAMQMTYGIATLAGLYLWTAAVVRDSPHLMWVWAAISLFPVSLMIAYGGMETALVVLLTGIVLRCTYEPHPSIWAVVAFVLLPWARPDAVVVGIMTIVAAATIGKQPRRAAAVYAVSLTAGAASWLVFNRVYFGALLPQSIRAKALMWMPSTLNGILVGGAARVRDVFFGHGLMLGIFTPIATRYLSVLSVPACLIVAAAAAVVAARPARFTAARPAVIVLAAVAFAMPVAYALGGAVAPWYFWASAVAGWLIVIIVCVAAGRCLRGASRYVAGMAGAGALVMLAAGQWVFAASWGTQENLYRAGIGDEIRALALPGDTLLLEPAGYVPFHARMLTWDEVGLASPMVTEYRSQYGLRWWIRFVQTFAPTFLLERDHMVAHRTYDGYVLSVDEQTWFAAHYALLRVFTYEPDRLRPPGLMRYVARLGSARDYYLYRRIDRPTR